MSEQPVDLRVGILDDHRSFGEAICLALEAAPGFESTGLATSIDECIDLVRSAKPDVMLIDYQLFEGNGIACAADLADAGFDVRLVLLTAHASPELEERAVAAGIEQVLSKDTPLAQVLGAVRSAAESPPLRMATEGRISFSDRQRDVLDLMGEGKDPAAIAEELFISLHTARGHVKGVMKLLQAPTQLAAVTRAFREGYLVPPRATATREA